MSLREQIRSAVREAKKLRLRKGKKVMMNDDAIQSMIPNSIYFTGINKIFDEALKDFESSSLLGKEQSTAEGSISAEEINSRTASVVTGINKIFDEALKDFESSSLLGKEQSMAEGSISAEGDERQTDERDAVHQCDSGDINICILNEGAKVSINIEPSGNFPSNVWNKNPNRRVSELELGNFLSEDGNAIKLNDENVMENTKKLLNALVVNFFGENIPSYVVNAELKR
ncbi:hypothetical protein KFK09_003824 [Dendrobium nobile]|uniref:Uncharacterized protein n=1 Tax=Dendrobium nobile TaxID=94219 RepID=A0A8T3C192_DENNO|nr:hypothetical protein KFK09_003824 [Dendrobium nobile]